MPYRTTQALVLQRSDYRENDRILTLFSPQLGRVDALCRGCRKPKSPLMAASELFTLGEYVLFTGKGKEMVQSCGVVEAFYPLRLDYERLTHAALMATACLRVIQPEEQAGHLFILLARSLRRLAFEDLPIQAVTTAFLLHFVTLTGYKPRLNHCARCGRALGEEGAYLLAQEDGLCCLSCGKDVPRHSWLSDPQLSWLRQVLVRGIDKASELPDSLPLELLRQYAQAKLETRLPGL